MSASKLTIIPRPAQAEVRPGAFIIQNNITFSYAADDVAAKTAANFFASQLEKACKLIFHKTTAPAADGIILRGCADIVEAEGYRLSVTTQNITVSAAGYAGFFNALQTLLQLLPAAVFDERAAQDSYAVPCVEISDYPRFSWRGMHLDVSRHFFPLSFIYKFIDMLALHKLNVFHWHLTDDQGWRIEIKALPELNTTGSWRAEDSSGWPWAQRATGNSAPDSSVYGGYYTQDEVRSVIAYAAERNITIVPEIELPGHSSEVLATFPDISCCGKALPVPLVNGCDWTRATVCAGNERTFEIFETILGEIIALFPSRYIHIGGDEADKTEWKTCPKCQKRIADEKLAGEDELQSWFIKRIEQYVMSKGRSIIGWDEILEGGLAPHAAVMSWRGVSGGIAAAQMEHNVVMTPGTHLYFDHCQSNPLTEPKNIGGLTTTKHVYSYEPVPPELTVEQGGYILGAQANIWTEYIETPAAVERMCAPRMAALSEVVWSQADGKNWPDFRRRLYTGLMPRYAAMKINAHPGSEIIDFVKDYDETGTPRVTMDSEIHAAAIRYSIDGSTPDNSSACYDKPLICEQRTLIRAAVCASGSQPVSYPSELLCGRSLAFGKPVVYNTPFSPKYPGRTGNVLTDGFTGSFNISDGYSQGFIGQDFDVTVDLQDVHTFRNVSVSFLQNTGHWIYFPAAITVLLSDDGVNFRAAGASEQPFEHNCPQKRKLFTVCGEFRSRFVRITGSNAPAPQGYPGERQINWLFADEIFID